MCSVRLIDLSPSSQHPRTLRPQACCPPALTMSHEVLGRNHANSGHTTAAPHKVSIKPADRLADIVRGMLHAPKVGTVTAATDLEQLDGYAGLLERARHPFRLVERDDLVCIAMHEEKGRVTG
jgi:hypothetical protein